MITLSAMVAAPQEMCWEMKHGYNAVKGMLRAPRSERRPEVFYFGETDSMEACRNACERNAECAAFTWMGTGKGGWLGGGAKWSLQCYGRGKQSMTMVPEADKTSGVKMPCAQLEELERSFGVDPARLTRSKEASKADAERMDSAAQPARADIPQASNMKRGARQSESDDEMRHMMEGRAGGRENDDGSAQAQLEAMINRRRQQAAGGGGPMGGASEKASASARDDGSAQAQLEAMINRRRQQAAGGGGGAPRDGRCLACRCEKR